MSDTAKRNRALLRVAVHVFDAYAHGASVPILAKEASVALSRALLADVDPGVDKYTMSRAAAELMNIANFDMFSIRAADIWRDHILRTVPTLQELS